MLYHLFRLGYFLVLKKVLAEIFDSEINFTHGYGFFSLSNVEISNKFGKIHCECFSMKNSSWNDFDLKNLNIDYDTFHEFQNLLQNIFKKISQKEYFFRFFNFSFLITDFQMKICKTDTKIKSLSINYSNNFFSLKSQSNLFDCNKLNISIPEFFVVLHYFDSIPSEFELNRPELSINLKERNANIEIQPLSGYSTESNWKFSTGKFDINAHLKTLFNDKTIPDTCAHFKFPQKIRITYSNGIIESIVHSVNCSDTQGVKILSINNLEVSKKKIHMESIEISTLFSFFPWGILQKKSFSGILSIKRVIFIASINNEERIILNGENFHLRNQDLSMDQFQFHYFSNNDGIFSANVRVLKAITHKDISFGSLVVEYRQSNKLSIVISELYRLIAKSDTVISILRDQIHFFVESGKLINNQSSSNIIFSRLRCTTHMQTLCSLSESLSMIQSLFPFFEGFDMITMVYSFAFHIKCSSMKIGENFFNELTTDGIIHLLIKPKIIFHQIDWCGMMNIMSSEALVHSAWNTKLARWLVNFDVGKLSLITDRSKFVFMKAKGDFNECQFVSFVLNDSTIGNHCEYRDIDGKKTLKAQELKHNNCEFSHAVIYLVNNEPDVITADRMDSIDSYILDFEYSIAQKHIRSSFISFDPLKFKFRDVTSGIKTASINKLNIGIIECNGLTIETDNPSVICINQAILNSDNTNISVQKMIIKNGEELSILIDKAEGDLSTSADLFAFFSMAFSFRVIITQISSLSLKLLGSSSYSQNMVEFSNLSLGQYVDDYKFTYQISASTFEMFDITSDKVLLLYMNPADPCFEATVTVKTENQQYIIENIFVDLISVYLNSNEEYFNTIYATFSPILELTEDSKDPIRTRYTFEEFSMSSYDLSMSYFNKNSPLFNQERVFQFKIPQYTFKSKPFTIPEFLNNVALQTSRSAKAKIYGIINAGEPPAQNQQSLQQKPGIFGFLSK